MHTAVMVHMNIHPLHSPKGSQNMMNKDLQTDGLRAFIWSRNEVKVLLLLLLLSLKSVLYAL